MFDYEALAKRLEVYPVESQSTLWHRVGNQKESLRES